MRIYFEVQELTDTNPEFIRLDITNKNQAEQDAILAALQDFMSGLTCTFTKHFCYHDEGGSCTVEVI